MRRVCVLVCVLLFSLGISLGVSPALALDFDHLLPPPGAVERFPWLGPAVSHPFPYGGGRVQVFRFGALFWNGTEVMLLNTLDEVARLGGDAALVRLGVPPHRPVRDQAEALALLDQVPAIRARVWTTPNWQERYGLPIAVDTSRPDFAVVRFQRAVLQEWKVATPWAQPGEVTRVPLEQLLPGTPLVPPTAWPQAAEPGWLRRLNAYRVAAGLLPVTEDPEASGRAAAHSRYMVLARHFAHEENRNSPYFSEAGDWAGQRGNILWSTTPLSGEAAIDVWWGSPPHADAMLTPPVRRMGYGTFTAPGTQQFAATLEIYTPANAGMTPEFLAQLPVAVPFRSPFTYLCPTRCAESRNTVTLWVRIWRRSDQPVERVRIVHEGVEQPVFLLDLQDGSDTMFTAVASCMDRPGPGRTHADLVVGGRTFSLDWTIRR